MSIRFYITCNIFQFIINSFCRKLIDLTNRGISGKKAEKKLEKAGITTNKNMVPFDNRSPMVTSGIRIGTPALTTRGFKENEMILIAKLMDNIFLGKCKCFSFSLL